MLSSKMLSSKFNVKRKLVAVLLIALTIRGILFFVVIDYPQGMLQPDSVIYISLAQNFLQQGGFFCSEKFDDVYMERTPGYPIFLVSILWLFGGSLLAIVVIQIILDSLSCVLIYHIGETVWEGSGLLSGILASINMGMITYSQLILNDSLFLFVFLINLIMMFRFLKEFSWKFGCVLGTGIGIAVMIRPVVIYLPLFLIPFFYLYLIFKMDIPPLFALRKAVLVGLFFVLSLSPWMMRNHIHYGRFKLTAQSGEHLLQYIVPFVWQYSKGIPFIEGMKQANKAFSEKVKREGINLANISPFEKSDLQVSMALDILKKEPKRAIIKAWVFGMAKNLFSPAIIDLSYLLNIERPHFFYTEGKTLIDRAWNFIRKIEGFFGWAVIGSLLFLFISRLIQLWGFIQVLWRKVWEAILLLLIVCYFLIVSGPVGYAKYRLPFEPILIILMAIGIKDVYGKLVKGNHKLRYKL